VGNLVQIDGSVTVLRDGRELPARLLAGGGELPPVEGGKTVRSRVDLAKAAQRSRRGWKPAPDHPWRRGFQPDAGAPPGRACVDTCAGI